MDSLVIYWDGEHLPAAFRELQPGQYWLEPVSFELTDEERCRYRQGVGRVGSRWRDSVRGSHGSNPWKIWPVIEGESETLVLAHDFKLIRRVEFADTDMAGIMHFANYFRFMEAAEHAFLRSLGFSVMMTHEGRDYGWPRVHVECDYRRPFRFEDEVEVHLTVREKKEKSLTYDFAFRRAGDPPDAVCATGSVTAVCITWDEATNQMKAVSIPAAMAEKITVAPV